MVRFVPLSDELIYDHPERIPRDGSARLVPFHLDLVGRGCRRDGTEAAVHGASPLLPSGGAEWSEGSERDSAVGVQFASRRQPRPTGPMG